MHRANTYFASSGSNDGRTTARANPLFVRCDMLPFSDSRIFAYGRGGDSLRIGHGAVWLTDYHRGLPWRIPIGQLSGH